MNDIYNKHYWNHIIWKQIEEIDERYFNNTRNPEKLYEDLLKVFGKRICIPFADMIVSTHCTLNCKNCSNWTPYLNNKKFYSIHEVENWMKNIFYFDTYIHIISPLGGEAFLNPDFAKILELLLELQKNNKIGYIRIVTNGTIYPDKQLQRILCNPNILTLVSRYSSNVLSETQINNYNHFIDFLQSNGCKYYEGKADWINLGTPDEMKKSLNINQLCDSFESCFAKDCVGIFNGDLYRCPRIYALENLGLQKPDKDEVIRFAEIQSESDLRTKLYKFYSKRYLRACSFCNSPEKRTKIPAAEQIACSNTN